jgi:hypothetical protein
MSVIGRGSLMGRDRPSDANAEATDRFLDFLDWLIADANHRDDIEESAGVISQADDAGETA